MAISKKERRVEAAVTKIMDALPDEIITCEFLEEFPKKLRRILYKLLAGRR